MVYRTGKRRRNQELFIYFKGHPDLSLGEIGEVFGISKQRVFQLIHNNKRDMVCRNCYHFNGASCSRRSAPDMVRRPNKCPDWIPGGK